MIITLEDYIGVHHITSLYIAAQTKITYITYALLSTLFLFSSVVFIRSFWLKEKFHLLIIQSLLLLAYAAGLSSGYCLQEFFVIGSQRSVIFKKIDQDHLRKVYFGFCYSFGTFSIAINTAHWIFAMRYWSLTVKLQAAILSHN